MVNISSPQLLAKRKHFHILLLEHFALHVEDVGDGPHDDLAQFVFIRSILVLVDYDLFYQLS